MASNIPDYYQQMQEAQFGNDRYFMTAPGGFYEAHPVEDRVPDERTGWKFHFSVRPEDVPKAWSIVVDRIMENEGFAAKVAKPATVEKMAFTDYGQSGKMITLYETETAAPDIMKAAIADIERKFILAGIRPGVAVKGDRPLPGSLYASYRNSHDDAGQYIKAKDIRDMAFGYNLSGKPDPYADFDLKTYTAPARSSCDIIVSAGPWKDGVSGSGEKISRIPVGHMSKEKLESLQKALVAEGFLPRLRNSQTLGLSLRVEGNTQIERIHEIEKSAQAIKSFSTAAKGSASLTDRLTEICIAQLKILEDSNIFPEEIHGKPALEALRNPVIYQQFLDTLEKHGNPEGVDALKAFRHQEIIRAALVDRIRDEPDRPQTPKSGIPSTPHPIG